MLTRYYCIDFYGSHKVPLEYTKGIAPSALLKSLVLGLYLI
jgi:hypothetical protein